MSSLLLSTFSPPIYSFLNVALYSRDGKEHRQKRKKEDRTRKKAAQGVEVGTKRKS